MIKVRIVLLASLATCALLAAGCSSLAGSACLKPPPEADVQNHAALRIPVGLDSVDTSAALKVPPLDNPAAPPDFGRCLEDPPMIQPLPDAVVTEKVQKKEARKAARKARTEKQQQKPPGPRLSGD